MSHALPRKCRATPLRFAVAKLGEAASALAHAGYNVCSPLECRPARNGGEGAPLQCFVASFRDCTIFMKVGWPMELSPAFGRYFVGFWRQPAKAPEDMQLVAGLDKAAEKVVEAADVVILDNDIGNCFAILRQEDGIRFQRQPWDGDDVLIDWLEEQREGFRAMAVR